MLLFVDWRTKLIINHVGNHFRYYKVDSSTSGEALDTLQEQQVSMLPCPRWFSNFSAECAHIFTIWKTPVIMRNCEKQRSAHDGICFLLLFVDTKPILNHVGCCCFSYYKVEGSGFIYFIAIISLSQCCTALWQCAYPALERQEYSERLWKTKVNAWRYMHRVVGWHAKLIM